MLNDRSLVQEIQNGQNIAIYLTGPRGVEYRRNDSSGELRWYLYDGLGNVVSEVISYEGIPPTPCATVTATREYDVYGAVRGGSGTGTTDHKFVGSLGHMTDDTGLIYMRARYYDPAIGRFISEDPAGNGINWYVYCQNNPMNLVDESGKSAVVVAASIIALTIGIMSFAVSMAEHWGFNVSPTTETWALALGSASLAISAGILTGAAVCAMVSGGSMGMGTAAGIIAGAFIGGWVTSTLVVISIMLVAEALAIDSEYNRQ